jgi:hypothetical protein
MNSASWHFDKATHGPGEFWVWRAGDAPAEGEWGYSYAALTDHRQKPPDYDAAVQGGEQARPTDVNIPVVQYNDSWAVPTLDGDIYVGTPGGGTGAAPPTNPAFHILPSTIHDSENKVLGPLKDAVVGKDGYDELKAYVERVGSWVFYRSEGATNHSPPSQDAVDAQAYLDTAVSGVADTIMVVGMFLQRLNDAGQMYVLADKQSTFPSQ